MNIQKLFLIFAFLLSTQCIFAQKTRTDAHIIGHVVDQNEEHIPFATIILKGTTIGTTTDETGHFSMINLPTGNFTVRAQFVGYVSQEKQVNLSEGKTVEIKFQLEEDILGLEEVVVTGDRSEVNRKESSTVVNTISRKDFKITQSTTISESLNFSPGLRTESNCQNCGFTQVRMNGMEGPYSQVLINSRPVFSGLAGVYGLELIPTNMIERVEVVRGGGSALYGGNAIAGTINLILRDPINNTYEVGYNFSLIGTGISGQDAVPDQSLNFNASQVSSDTRSGMSFYGFYRDRKPYDANNDGFSELTSIGNTTIGGRIYHRFGTRNKMAADFFVINEDRRGGDKHDYPLHESNTSEAVDHQILSGALSFDQFFREKDKLSVFVSGQSVNRDSYYGANQSLTDYGLTTDFTYVAGLQYTTYLGQSKIITGIENQGSWLMDTKLGYPDFENATLVDDGWDVPHTSNVIVANQSIYTSGAFLQYELDFDKFKISAGTRYDNYTISDRAGENDNHNGVLIPRLTLKYSIGRDLEARVGYSQGYRAPQIFDEDLHIETSGSRKVLHRNAADLEQESSASYTASLDFDKRFNNSYLSLLIEGFYTRLSNPFANEFSQPDNDGVVIYTRVNAGGGATVQGINVELDFVPIASVTLQSGITLQQSNYDEKQEFNETRFFRTPKTYGYLALDYRPGRKFGVSATTNYTGSMLVPYFGTEAANSDAGELRESDDFIELGIKLDYTMKLNGASLQISGGIKNILNAYQSDFDSGIDRDPAYVYGPIQPRMLFFGLKFGNNL